MPVGVGVNITGLRELRAGLRKVDRAVLKDLRIDLKRAADLIAADARRRVPVRTGRARASIRSVAGGNTIYIAGGKKKVPYYGWLDFGGTLGPVGRRRNTQHRPKLSEGRYIYPAISAKNRELIEAADRAFRRAARRGGIL